MKLVGRVPVEPLSDERLTNIERAIVAGAADAAAKARPRESRWHVLGFAMATIVLVVGAGFVGWKLRGGGEQAAVAESGQLAVKTDATTSTIDIGDARITSDPATAFTVARAGTGVTIVMARGKVGLEVGKRGAKDPLIVRAGDTDVEVVGTRFTVDFDEITGEVDVRVTEGKVKIVRHRKQEAFVAAGEVWQTKRGVIALADAGTKIAAKADPNTGASGDVKPDDIEIPVEPGKDIGLHDRTAMVPDARIPTTGSGGSAKITQGRPENVRPRTPDASSSPNIDFVNAILRQEMVPALDVKLDPASAVAKYREMAAWGAKGDQASLAFYSIAVVQHLKLGRSGDAMRTLEQYFRRFRPDANEYVAARWLDVRAKCLRLEGRRWRLVLDDRCRQAAYTYAHTAPASPMRTVAESLSTATR